MLRHRPLQRSGLVDGVLNDEDTSRAILSSWRANKANLQAEAVGARDALQRSHAGALLSAFKARDSSLGCPHAISNLLLCKSRMRSHLCKSLSKARRAVSVFFIQFFAQAELSSASTLDLCDIAF